MSILNQIKDSKLSKQGKTSTTGQFEGTPSNVAIVERGSSVPINSPAIPPAINPVDVVFESMPQPTYLDYMRSANKK